VFCFVFGFVCYCHESYVSGFMQRETVIPLALHCASLTLMPWYSFPSLGSTTIGNQSCISNLKFFVKFWLMLPLKPQNKKKTHIKTVVWKIRISLGDDFCFCEQGWHECMCVWFRVPQATAKIMLVLCKAAHPASTFSCLSCFHFYLM